MRLQVSVAGCFVFLFHPAKYVSLSMFLIAYSSHINLEQISLMSHTPNLKHLDFLGCSLAGLLYQFEISGLNV